MLNKRSQPPTRKRAAGVSKYTRQADGTGGGTLGGEVGNGSGDQAAPSAVSRNRRARTERQPAHADA